MLDKGVAVEMVRTCLDSWCDFKVEPTGFIDGFNVECDRKLGIR